MKKLFILLILVAGVAISNLDAVVWVDKSGNVHQQCVNTDHGLVCSE